jgi:acetoin utilization deacetylase AcuC-like enzyme
MKCAYITHPVCLQHDNGVGHPESPARLTAIYEHLKASPVYEKLDFYAAPLATNEQIQRVHAKSYIESIENIAPGEGEPAVYLDPDTRLADHSLEAAKRASGAVVLATELVMEGQVDHAFCAVRSPGHHAKHAQAMGFCIFNNVTVGIAHALQKYGLERVALVDFDVHHGNGSENILKDESRVMFCSSFQHPYYPNEPFAINHERIICTPLAVNSGGIEFRQVVEEKWLPALERFKPQMIFISAGFDAHKDDFLAGLKLDESDYQWITEKIVGIAARYADKRIISTLEGGYNTEALANSVEVHLKVLSSNKETG